MVARSLKSIESKASNDLELCNGSVSVKELGDTGIWKISHELTSTNYHFNIPPIGPEKVLGVTSKIAKLILEEVHSPIDFCQHVYNTEVSFFRPLPLLEEKKGIGQFWNNVRINVQHWITTYILASFRPSLISYFPYSVKEKAAFNFNEFRDNIKKQKKKICRRIQRTISGKRGTD